MSAISSLGKPGPAVHTPPFRAAWSWYAGANALQFSDFAGNVFWFSYRELVAFCGPSGRKVVRRNDWSVTTGKHINAIDGGDTAARKARVDGAEFMRLYEAEFASAV